MDIDSQIVIPPAFIAVFVPPGRVKPTASREHIAARHEFCEDLAQMLVDTAQRLAQSLTEPEVLARLYAGLVSDGEGEAAAVDGAEARWLIGRLAELLDWPQWAPPTD